MTTKPKGVVAAGHETTANAAAQMLASGGNAFDAVLAGLFASVVPEVVLASLGGGGHMMAHIAKRNQTILYDFFVDTPAKKRPADETDFRSVHVDFGPAKQEFHVGIGTAAVPGFIPGVFAIHDDLCTLPMTSIVKPAIDAARNGVTMNGFQSYLFSIVEPILTTTAKAAIFAGPDGALLKTGQTLRNENLAQTLEAVATHGPRLFSDGEVGQEIVRQSRYSGGHLTLTDLATYKVEKRKPLTHEFHGHALSLNPAPAASGALIAFGLALLEALSPDEPASPVTLARILKATNDVRAAHAGDLTAITSADVILQQLKSIKAHALAPRGTTHISVIDALGNAASATISNGESNGHLVGDFGFMLNNMLGEEDLNPSGFNTWAPGTRMSTMMAPTILRSPDGSLTALGSGGSNRIRSAVLQVAQNLIVEDMPLKEAVASPRMHFEKCGTLSFEDLISNEHRTSLVQTFSNVHPWPDRNMFFGGVHTVRANANGTFEAAGDPRRSGVEMFIKD